MLAFDGFLGVLAFAVWAFCLVDALITPRDRVRTLPKMLWVLVIVLLFVVGAVAWLVAGRSRRPLVRERALQPARAMSPDDDEEFLRSISVRRDRRPDDDET